MIFEISQATWWQSVQVPALQGDKMNKSKV